MLRSTCKPLGTEVDHSGYVIVPDAVDNGVPWGAARVNSALRAAAVPGLGYWWYTSGRSNLRGEERQGVGPVHLVPVVLVGPRGAAVNEHHRELARRVVVQPGPWRLAGLRRAGLLGPVAERDGPHRRVHPRAEARLLSGEAHAHRDSPECALVRWPLPPFFS